MYDAVFVLVEAFSKLLKKKPDQFRSYTTRRGISSPFTPNATTNMHGIGPNGMSMAGGSGGLGSAAGSGTSNGNSNGRVLDCNTSKGWEHGDKISRYLRKVSAYDIILLHYTYTRLDTLFLLLFAGKFIIVIII